MHLGRRQLLQGLLGASVLGGGLVLDPRLKPEVTSSFAPRSRDAFRILRDAVRLNRRVDWTKTAQAAPTSNVVVVSIKVMSLMHTPLCFRLGKVSGSDPTTTALNPGVPMTQKFGSPTVLGTLRGLGLEKLSSNPRWASLRLNNWFAGMLDTGAFDGGAAYPSGLAAGDFGAFPENVGFQAFLGLDQVNKGANHSFTNVPISQTAPTGTGGDIAHHLDAQHLVASPLGIVCMTAGVGVQITDSAPNYRPNQILASDLSTPIAVGTSVGDFTAVVAQAAQSGLIDDTLCSTFDAIINADRSVATSINQQQTTLQNATTTFGAVAALERTKNPSAPATFGAFQTIGSNSSGTVGAVNQPANLEFLAQCKFVQQALTLAPGAFRNFSLLVNATDIDGAPLDTSGAGTGSAGRPNDAVSNVEAMRQLAMGLNLLAKVMNTVAQQNIKMYVVVVTEGGRNENLQDDGPSHAFIMGPDLQDHLYADLARIDDASDPAASAPNGLVGIMPANKASGIPFSEKVLLSDAGAIVTGTPATMGSVQLGLIRHIESVLSVPTTCTGLGNYVKIA